MQLSNTTIVCIRHGESEANFPLHQKDQKDQNLSKETINELIKAQGGDSSLTERGLEQARATALHLDPIFDTLVDTDNVLLYTSCLKRAQQTAAAFQQKDTQPLYLKKLQIIPEMKEYRRDDYVNAASFIEQIFKLFELLSYRTEASASIEPQIIVLFGHSLAFSVLFTIISFYKRGIKKETHKQLVMDQLLSSDPEKPKYLNTLFQLPNCSISVIQGLVEAVPRLDNPNKSNLVIDWRILGIGKVEHLVNDLKTGTQSPF